jgi:3-oxoacyl-[acyl-carrier protein] reductase
MTPLPTSFSNLLMATGGHHCLLKYDVSDPIQTEKCLNSWIKNNPEAKIHVLVNNSGIRKDNLLIFMPNEDWENVIDTNLNSFFYTTKIISHLMVRNRSVVSSTWSLYPV